MERGVDGGSGVGMTADEDILVRKRLSERKQGDKVQHTQKYWKRCELTKAETSGY